MDTFQDIFKSGFLEGVTEFSLVDTLVGMAFAVAIGLFIFVVYKKTFAGVMYSTGFAMTLIGLALVTTLVIMAVTSNVVLSLGMVGALSIVRFRAAIKEPMEIVYLFWSIAAGIVIGAGMIPLAVLGSGMIGCILLLFSNRKIHENPYILILDCGDERAEDSAMAIAREAVARLSVKSKTVNAAGIELTMEIRMKDGETAFVNRLTALFRQNRFYEKRLYGLIVSGYSGGDLLARQLISGLNMNKSFYLPPRFCMMETANEKGSLIRLPGAALRGEAFAKRMAE